MFQENLGALRRLPAVTLLLSGALGAVGGQRWSNLEALTRLTVNDRSETLPLLYTLSLWHAVNNNESVAQLLALSVVQDLSLEDADTRRRGFGKLYCPLEHWLAGRLRPHLDGLFMLSSNGFDLLLDKTMVYLGVIEQDLVRNDERWQSTMGASWYGRASISGRYRPGATALDEWRQQFDTDKGNWAPLQDGLFGGDPARAQDAFDRYTVHFTKVLGHRY